MIENLYKITHLQKSIFFPFDKLNYKLIVDF
jgi:hypothetical protein